MPASPSEARKRVNNVLVNINKGVKMPGEDFSEATYRYIKAIDNGIKGKYSTSLNSVLTNPDDYLGKEGMKQTVQDMKKDANDYFDAITKEHGADTADFEEGLKNATQIYNSIDSTISAKAKEANIPYISPVDVERNTDDEEIIIEEYGEAEEGLVEKLVGRSDYIADISTAYKNYVIGRWIFAGSKRRALSVNPPTSPILEIESSRAEINNVLDYVSGA